MSIKILDLAQETIVELNAVDSNSIFGGTRKHRTTVSVPVSAPASGGNASVASLTTIGSAVTVQTANASGGNTNFANASSGGTYGGSGGGFTIDGGAAALSTNSGANVNIGIDFKGAFNRT